MAKEIENNIIENIVVTTVEDVLHNSMIPYAESVILERALPRVEDGLKPVQRRILFSMSDLGLTPDKPYKKSAKVVGECLAKYHPHGDTSVYDAMVKMAQSFSMGMKLVDGQGNYGSIDGDGAAAMRYTEARLNDLSMEMLRDIDKDTVEWQNNYDDSLKEPVTLPSRFPNILVNGAMGIAVGLATNIPPHNLAECIDGAVAVINNPKIKVDEIMKIIPGPDFPTGGKVVVTDELKKAYETGVGKIIIKPTVSVENDTNGKTNLVITEIPYRVNKSDLLGKIGELIEKRDGDYAGIADAVDESDRHGMRIVIKVRKDYDAVKIYEKLLKDTQLSCTFGINMVVIANGKPQQLGLVEILRCYTDYQKSVVLRRTKFDLNKAKVRCEIVEGLIIAVTNIDKVIAIIKKSPDTPTAKQNLRNAFNLSDIQAQAILDLKLGKLTRLEIDNLKDELAQLKELIKSLQEIIDSKKKLNEVVISEMLAIKKAFKIPRRTRLEKEGKETQLAPQSGNVTNDDSQEDMVIGYTADGQVKKLAKSSFTKSKIVATSLSSIFVTSCVVPCGKDGYAFTNYGNVLRIKPSNIIEGRNLASVGTKLKSLFKNVLPSEKIVALFCPQDNELDKKVIMFTTQGMVKITEFKEFMLSQDLSLAIKLKEGDSLLAVEWDDDTKDMFFATERGMCLRAEKTEVPTQGRVAGGVKGMDVDSDDKVITATLINDDTSTVAIVGTSFGTFKKVLAGSISKIARARKGVKLCELGDRKNNEIVVFVKCADQNDDIDFAIVDRLGIMVNLNSKEIPEDSRTTKGKIIPSIGVVQPDVVYCARHKK